MLSSIQLFSLLLITLTVFSMHIVNGVPLSSDVYNDVSSETSDQAFSKRKLPVEGILIGRRDYPTEGILMGRRDYPTEGILFGKRNYQMEGILLGKREYPTEGILMGKRNFRFFAPKSSAVGTN